MSEVDLVEKLRRALKAAEEGEHWRFPEYGGPPTLEQGVMAVMLSRETVAAILAVLERGQWLEAALTGLTLCQDPGADYHHPERGWTRYTCQDRVPLATGDELCPGCRIRAALVDQPAEEQPRPEEDPKRRDREITQEDLELSARHAASTDPRSIRSADEIARRLRERGVDTSVRRRPRPEEDR